ncbi:MAG: class I SAM-dependent methyltransferase [Clostridiaceae bacterium]|nr:class I SAM-dependent methyltransferase [Clostridiaceae bacterium]
MKTRGEKQYIHMPSIVARLYDNLTSVKGVNKTFEDISLFVDSILNHGKLLDIGTGPGRLLLEINKKIPQLDLFGLDISESMLAIAKQNLKNIKGVDLQVGNIVQTDYQDNFFDCIVSSGSFYNWDRPVDGLNEIYRILQSGKTAFIFDSNRDYDRAILNSRLEENLQGYTCIRRMISKYFLKKQLRMTYSISEYDHILKQTKFADSFNIHQIELGNLPIYVRIELYKE